MADSSKDNAELLSTALGHTWAWYAQGMGHRLQMASMFMLVVAANIAGYIASLQAHADIIAGGVGIVATVVVTVFALLSGRARERVNIAAISLQAIEDRIADVLNLPELRTVERINATRSRWKSTAVRANIMYSVLAAAFLSASGYAFSIALGLYQLQYASFFRRNWHPSRMPHLCRFHAGTGGKLRSSAGHLRAPADVL
jgi:hypothetical protein